MTDQPFKLPVWDTLRAALRETRGGFGVYLRLIPVALMLWLTGSIFISLMFYNNALADLGRGPPTSDVRSLRILRVLSANLLMHAALVPAITAWHRYLILGLGHPAARVRYSVGGAEWKYAGIAIVVGLWFVMAEMAGALLSDRFPMSSWSYGVARQLLNLLAWAVIARWLLYFPAAAVGRPGKSDDLNRIVRHNTFRLWFVVMLPQTIAWLAYHLLYVEWLVPGGASRALAVANGVASTVATFLFLPVSMGALSIAYRWLALPPAEAAR